MTILPTLVFLHGWGFDSTYWEPLRDFLAHWPQRSVDRGYFDTLAGHPSDEQNVALSNQKPQTTRTTLASAADEKVIVIGHSFGFLHALMCMGAMAQTMDAPERNIVAMVSINGFTRFSAASDFPGGVSPRMIDRMMTKLRSAPDTVVSDFRQRCGWRNEPATNVPLNVGQLLADLQILKDGDGRNAYHAAMHAMALPCLVLAGTEDAIVPAAMTRAAFPDRRIVWRESGDHLLPTSATEWCAQHIHAFLETFSVDVP